MLDPAGMSPGSIMPAYPWLLENDLDTSLTATKIKAMQTLGIPYPKNYDKVANIELINQANGITNRLKKDGMMAINNKEIIALIAYLQRLGTDIKVNKKTKGDEIH